MLSRNSKIVSTEKVKIRHGLLLTAHTFNIRPVLAFIVVICAVLLSHSIVTAEPIWESEVITSEPGFWEASLALDQGNNPHVSYRLYHVDNGGVQYDKMLYSYKDAQGWVSSIFDNDGGAYESLAIDSQGRPHISYFDQQSEDLVYTYLDGNHWQAQIIDQHDRDPVGGFTSIVLDENDNPRISYIDWTRPYRIKYASNDGSTWDITEFPGWLGRTSLTLDSSGNPHIAAGGEYGYWDGSSWQISAFTSDSGIGWLSIELDSAGNPHIAYSDGMVKYAYWNGSSWEVSTIGYGFTLVSLELDSRDVPHIMYGSCEHVTLVDGNWVMELLAIGHFEGFILDSYDRIHFVYTPAFKGLIYVHDVSEPMTYPPVADAGDDIVAYAGVDGTASVKLNGSGSFDSDGDVLEYFWFNDAHELIAEGVDPNVVFAAGVHVIELIVNDGTEDSESNSVVVTVIEAIEARAYVFPRAINTTSKGRYVIARMELSDGVSRDDMESDSLTLMIGDAVIESVRQRAITAGNRHYLFGFFDRGEVVAQAVGKPKLDIIISGKLVTGQCIYGEDSIRIVKSNGPERTPLGRIPARGGRGRRVSRGR